jgi:hypothetical protein
VVKVKCKINATDQDGSKLSDAKIIADMIVEITDEEVDRYRATGEKTCLPNNSRKPKKNDNTNNIIAAGGNVPVSTLKPKIEYSKIFVHVKDPQNHDLLLKLKQTFNNHPGNNEVILVLGDKSSAVRMPFTVKLSEDLKKLIADIFGEDCVALK